MNEFVKPLFQGATGGFVAKGNTVGHSKEALSAEKE
jgi:hypothetical protein